MQLIQFKYLHLLVIFLCKCGICSKVLCAFKCLLDVMCAIISSMAYVALSKVCMDMLHTLYV